ncbi:MAG: hypothetical protein ACMXYA_02710 [Candidatus Woesearchaeota archaeon]
MKKSVDENPKVKQDYVDKLNRIRKQKSIPIGDMDNFRKRYDTHL